MNTVEGSQDDALAGSAIHDQWVSTYRTAEAQAFYELAFEEIVRRLAAPPDSTILDAGCGSCAKSVLLAARGFRVVAADFSLRALELGTQTVRDHRCEDRITLRREDLLNLSFADATFRYAICWGVLMHVPELERALSELARVITPGGLLVLSEGNMYSVQSLALRMAKRVLRRGRGRVVRTAAGLESIEEANEGTLLTRQTDIPSFLSGCERIGLHLQARLPGQLTELYALAPSVRLKRAIHVMNRVWFHYVGWAGPAFGNILILRKNA